MTASHTSPLSSSIQQQVTIPHAAQTQHQAASSSSTIAPAMSGPGNILSHQQQQQQQQLQSKTPSCEQIDKQNVQRSNESDV